jgi:hypothetical protein
MAGKSYFIHGPSMLFSPEFNQLFRQQKTDFPDEIPGHPIQTAFPGMNRIMFVIPVCRALTIMKTEQVRRPFGPATHVAVFAVSPGFYSTPKTGWCDAKPEKKETIFSVLQYVAEFMPEHTIVIISAFPGDDSDARQRNRRSFAEPACIQTNHPHTFIPHDPHRRSRLF